MPPTSTPYHPPPDDPPGIAYEDAHLLVVDKPAGLLSVPGRGPEKADCLEARLRARGRPVLTVHRLDMETSGLVVFSLDLETQRALSALFAARAVEKSYIADVHGTVTEDDGRIDLPLAADWPNRPKQQVLASGKPAETRWQRLGTGAGQSRLALFPTTGRTHQLRVHLSAIGHPILGDTLYGTGDVGATALRLHLHATRLSFRHPVTNARVDARSSCPF